MGGITVDASEVVKLAADMVTAADQLAGAIRPAVEDAAADLKAAMRDDMADSSHFRQVAPAITYSLRAGITFAEAEVGPVTAGGTVGDLAHFAYFGGAHGGGGTVRDPIDPALEQSAGFARGVADAVRGDVAMISHLQAIKAELAPLGYTIHLIAAPEVTGQYLVLGGRTWAAPQDAPLCDTSQSLEIDWRVKAVGGTPEGVGIMLDRVRALLSPFVNWTPVTMAGRSVWVQFERSEFLNVDRDTVIVGTNRHPAVGVDTYQLMSEPA